MVVGNLLAVAHSLDINMLRHFYLAEICRYFCQFQYTHCHVIRKISAVCSGVSTELFLIQLLEVVQGLSCCISHDTIGVSLQCGQIIKGRRILLLFFSLHGFNSCILPSARGCHCFSDGLIFLLFCLCVEPDMEFHGVERFRNKGRNLSFSLNNKSQRGRDDTANVKLGAIHQGEQTGSIDANQPVCLRSAEGRLIQAIVLRTSLQLLKPLSNCCVLHRGDPQPHHRFLAFCEIIGSTKNQFAFATSITCIDHCSDVIAMHQRLQDLKLTLFVVIQLELKEFREDRKVFLLPFRVFLVIHLGIGKTCQVAKAPGDNVSVAFLVTFMFGSGTQNRSNALGNRRFLSDYKLHYLSSSSS